MAHATTHAVHELTHDGETNALPTFASAEEGQENLPLEPCGYTRPVVAHCDLEAAAATLPGLHPQTWRGHIRRGLLRIVKQGKQRLLQLPFVG